jgi:hypothetical protein
VSSKTILRNSALTHKLLRTMVAGIIRSIQARVEHTDADMADILGVSATTVGNARNERNDLSALTLIQIGRRYSMDDLQPLASLIDAKLVPLDPADTVGQSTASCITKLLLQLSVALEDGKVDDAELTAMRGALDEAGRAIDAMRERLKPRAA